MMARRRPSRGASGDGERGAQDAPPSKQRAAANSSRRAVAPKPSQARPQSRRAPTPLAAAEIGLRRERTRDWMALGLIGLLVLMFVGTFIALIVGAVVVHELKELSIFIAPLVGLVGPVIGFYFGRAAK